MAMVVDVDVDDAMDVDVDVAVQVGGCGHIHVLGHIYPPPRIATSHCLYAVNRLLYSWNSSRMMSP